jgi:hypothetical protein
MICHDEKFSSAKRILPAIFFCRLADEASQSKLFFAIVL